MSEIVGHIILCATSILTIRQNPSLSWISITLELLLAHGLLGVSDKYVNSPALRNVFEITTNILEILPLAFLNTQFLLPMKPSLAYLHASSVIAPLTSGTIEYDQLDSERIKNIVIFGNVGTAIYLAIELRNLWFIALAAVAILNRFFAEKEAEKLKINRSQALSVGLAFFCILITLCLRAL